MVFSDNVSTQNEKFLCKVEVFILGLFLSQPG